ncbi:aspartyl-phosphate phosphatase Spo0E family protein [Fictibacillus sp. Mic-4]|uniref:aspartyl-phosphate phosphatase Spo0E family protein n=1 Tax=Fictibacillus TaxID=1329200 RepID=UPI00041BFEA6|nr:aspartyl-phosphate phosphatase Spo0E family protein [Fictibacillus gelatini]
MNRNRLLNEIEMSRQKMNEMSQYLPLISEELLELSQHIDELLNEFDRLKLKNSYS